MVLLADSGEERAVKRMQEVDPSFQSPSMPKKKPRGNFFGLFK